LAFRLDGHLFFDPMPFDPLLSSTWHLSGVYFRPGTTNFDGRWLGTRTAARSHHRKTISIATQRGQELDISIPARGLVYESIVVPVHAVAAD
jgi:hypothetical protein